jgi:voltage-gated potassium channel
MVESSKRFLAVLIIIALVIIYGTAGFMLIQKLSFIDSLYMTFITMTTVGFGLIKPLSSIGKIFVITLIIAGVSVVGFTVSVLVQYSVEGFLSDYFGRRRMNKHIEKLSGHYIIAGYGRVGHQIAIEFAKAKKKFVVIENDPEKINELVNESVLFIEGDATQDDILIEAGVKEAKGLIAALNTDADNVFIILTARGLSKDIKVVARASTAEAEPKLISAGANRVISPYSIGARRMAALLLQPVVSDYLDLVTHGDVLAYRLEEFKINEGSQLDDKSIEDIHIRRKTGALVLAIKRDGELNTNPKPDYALKANDRLVALGTSDQLEELEKLV